MPSIVSFLKLGQLKLNVLSGSVFSISNSLILLVTYPIFLRYLGIEIYGLWATLSVVIFFSQMGELGISNAVSKFVAQYWGQKDLGGVKQTSTNGLVLLSIPLFIIILSSLILPRYFANILSIADDFKETSVLLITYLGLLSVIILVVEYLKGIINGLGRVDLANYFFLASKIVNALLSICLIFLSFGIWSLFIGALVGYLFLLISYIYIIRFKFNIAFFLFSKISKHKMKELLAFGGKVMGTRLLYMLITPMNKIVIARYIGLESVTFYEIGYKVAVTARSVFEGGLKAIMPKISELQSSSKNITKDIKSIKVKCIKLISYFALPSFILLILCGKIILSIWLGDDYDYQMTYAVQIFSFGYIVNLYSIPQFYILMGVNRVKYCFWSSFIRVLIHFVLMIALIVLVTPTLLHVLSITIIAMIISSIYLFYTFEQQYKNEVL